MTRSDKRSHWGSHNKLKKRLACLTCVLILNLYPVPHDFLYLFIMIILASECTSPNFFLIFFIYVITQISFYSHFSFYDAKVHPGLQRLQFFGVTSSCINFIKKNSILKCLSMYNKWLKVVYLERPVIRSLSNQIN